MRVSYCVKERHCGHFRTPLNFRRSSIHVVWVDLPWRCTIQQFNFRAQMIKRCRVGVRSCEVLMDKRDPGMDFLGDIFARFGFWKFGVGACGCRFYYFDVPLYLQAPQFLLFINSYLHLLKNTPWPTSSLSLQFYSQIYKRRFFEGKSFQLLKNYLLRMWMQNSLNR